MNRTMLTRFIFIILAMLQSGLGVCAPEMGSYTPPEVKSFKEPVELKLKNQADTRKLIRFDPPTDMEIQALKKYNSKRNASAKEKALQIGFGREVSPAIGDAVAPLNLSWQLLAGGGQVTQFTIISPNAAALRVALAANKIPSGAELRFVGSKAPGNVLGPVTAAKILKHQIYWSPMVEGDSLTVEIYLPAGMTPGDIEFNLVKVSHLLSSPTSLDKNFLQEKAGAAACELDAVCHYNSGGIQSAATSVARMIFTDPIGGSSYYCSGTLLNSVTLSAPYFYSASHCISDQPTASTLNTFWFYESASCNSATTNSGTRTLTGGATLLYNDTVNDGLLLRLNDSAPAGASFSGWNASAVTTGTSLVGLHHPAGDHKKISLGSTTGQGPLPDGSGSYTAVAWTQGITEGGSSGSGLFVMNATSGQYQLRGGLWGGASSCAAPTAPDFYSRFDLAYPHISGYLDSSAASVTPQTGWWWNPSESGRGFTIEVSGNNLFMAGYLYAANTGQAIWFVSGGGMSSSSSYQGQMTAYGNGQTLTGAYIAPVPTVNIGTISLTFSDAAHGTLTWPGGTIPIERFNIVANGVNAPQASFQPETGWWWNSSENGRGFALEIQNGVMFLAGYMYDSAGNPIWYSSANSMSSQSLYQGNWLQYANGQTLMGSYRAPVVVNSSVGALQIQFQTTTSGTLTLPDGRAIPISRFRF